MKHVNESVILFAILLIIAIYWFSTQKDTFENFTDISKINILNTCKDIKPSDFITIISNGDLKNAALKIKEICKKFNIDPILFSDKNNYPMIASYLVSVGYLNYNCK